MLQAGVARKQKSSSIMEKNQPHSSEDDVWSRPNWSPRLEKAFVELLQEEMKVHFDVCATGFSEEIWDHVTEEFRKETGLNYDKMELKKHLAVLKKRYHIVKPLYDESGFGWDYRRKMVDIDDGIWEEIIKVTPQVAPYRKYGCPLYDDLCMIFTKPTATGKHAFAPGDECFTRVSMSKPRRSSNKRKSSQPLRTTSSKKTTTTATTCPLIILE